MEPKRNIKLTIAYDGTNYLGWQKTKMGPSIEESLERVLTQILQEPITLQAASRTDAGVHARAQVVNFFTCNLKQTPDRLKISLNQLLPNDIAITNIEDIHPQFHPTLDSTSKEYHYTICNDFFQLPQNRLYSWHYPYTLDLTIMQEAKHYFLGEKDFASFCNVKKNETYSDTIRNIENIEIKPLPDNRVHFKIVGNHFLYKMVRNIVGTLVYIGCGKIQIKDLPLILEGRNRIEAGITAPACGLTLHKIYYNK